jgi:hypothetical protein
VRRQPALNLIDFVDNIRFISLTDLVFEFLVVYCMLHVDAVALKSISSLYFSL